VYLKCDLGGLGEGGGRKDGLDLRHDLGTDDAAVRADDGDVEANSTDRGEVERKVLSDDTRRITARRQLVLVVCTCTHQINSVV